MNRHVVEVGALHERASATPGLPARAKVVSAAVPARVERAPATEDTSLHGTQLWFARAVMTPESEPPAAGDDDIARRLTAGPGLSAAERLEIYRRGYHARLVECLADDYPVLKHALGDPAFEDLCRAYIARHPSEGPSLNLFGRAMAPFCRFEAPAPFPLRDFAGDLASLEWAIVEVIHAASRDPLTLEGLRDLPPEAWVGARLVPNGALRMLRFAHPVNAYFQAYREGSDPTLPGSEPSATVVYRSGPTVWRMDLTVPMYDILSALVAGEPLAAALGRAESALAGMDPAEASQRVTHWFREWVSGGLFSAVER
jgi:hypothetical protein